MLKGITNCKLQIRHCKMNMYACIHSYTRACRHTIVAGFVNNVAIPSIHVVVLNQWLQFRDIHLSFDRLLDKGLHKVYKSGENG